MRAARGELASPERGHVPDRVVERDQRPHVRADTHREGVRQSERFEIDRLHPILQHQRRRGSGRDIGADGEDRVAPCVPVPDLPGAERVEGGAHRTEDAVDERLLVLVTKRAEATDIGEEHRPELAPGDEIVARRLLASRAGGELERRA